MNRPPPIRHSQALTAEIAESAEHAHLSACLSGTAYCMPVCESKENSAQLRNVGPIRRFVTRSSAAEYLPAVPSVKDNPPYLGDTSLEPGPGACRVTLYRFGFKEVPPKVTLWIGTRYCTFPGSGRPDGTVRRSGMSLSTPSPRKRQPSQTRLGRITVQAVDQMCPLSYTDTVLVTPSP